MDNRQLAQQLKQEFFGGWKPFEVIWLALFILIQIWVYWQAEEPESWISMVAGISGILCVVFISKGKISNYLFGLINAYSYFYVSLSANYLGEVNTVLYVYLPSQFIGYFLWKMNMQKQQGSEAVITKALSLKGWVILLAGVTIGSLVFIEALKYYGGSSAGLDGVTTILVVAAQLLMILRYREQWALWIIINILSIILWADHTAIYLTYGAYLLNALYGYYNWTKLQKA